jgi:AcrR family transcriptional regulator
MINAMASAPIPTEVARRGRPRSERARAAILAAASAILAEQGLREMTVDDVAERAGVSKATIYRWWKSKAELALDAFVGDVRARVPVPDTGSLAGDLRARLRATVRTYARPPLRPVLTALVGEAQFDPAFAEMLRQHVVRPLREGSRDVFRRAIERGEIPVGAPFDLALDMAVGAIYYRLLLGTGPIDVRLADQAVDLVLAALRTPGPSSGTPESPGSRERSNRRR